MKKLITKIKSLFKSRKHPNLSDMAARIAEIANGRYYVVKVEYHDFSSGKTKIDITGYIDGKTHITANHIDEVCEKLANYREPEKSILEDVKRYRMLKANTILYTKDGRKIGNAIITKPEGAISHVKTDYGNSLKLTSDQIYDMFYIREYFDDHEKEYVETGHKYYTPC